jgi:hypothetical protein
MKLPAKVQVSLILVLLMAVPMFARCVSHGYWVTVVATGMLVAGALASLAGRTWGVGLTLLAGSAFPAAYFLGMAPPIFLGVGYVGALPFVLTWKPMAFFDRPAAKLFATLAIAGGIACAVTWHEVGPWVVANLYP